MCVVSMISQHYQQNWPTVPEWPPQRIFEFVDLMRKAREIDEKTGQPDCISPDKAEFEKSVLDALKSIQDRLTKLEENSTPLIK